MIELTKGQFDDSKKPYTLIISLNPKTGKCLFTYFDGWDNQHILKKFTRDFPARHHFSRQNKEARRRMCIEKFNYDPFAKPSQKTGKSEVEGK